MRGRQSWDASKGVAGSKLHAGVTSSFGTLGTRTPLALVNDSRAGVISSLANWRWEWCYNAGAPEDGVNVWQVTEGHCSQG